MTPNDWVIAVKDLALAAALLAAAASHASGEEARKPIKTLPLTDESSHVAFSPTGDLLVAGGGEEGVLLWSTKDWTTLKVHPEPMPWRSRFAFSPDGRRLAWATDNGTVVFDTSKLEVEAELSQSAEFLAFLADGKSLITDSDVRGSIWDVEKRIKTVPRVFKDRVQPRALSPDKAVVASFSQLNVGGLGKTFFWRLPKTIDPESTGKAVAPQHIGTLDGYGEITFSPDGKQLVGIDAGAPGGAGVGVRLFPSLAERWSKAIGLEDVEGVVLRAVFSPDGKVIVCTGETHFSPPKTAGDPFTSFLWALDATNGKKLYEWPTEFSRVNDICLSPDGKLLATAHRDKAIHIWNMTDVWSSR